MALDHQQVEADTMMEDPVERVALHLGIVRGGRDEKTIEAVFDWIEQQGIPIDKLLSDVTQEEAEQNA